MASVQYEIDIEASAQEAWRALREVGLAHKLFAGVLVDGRIDGDVRTVTFANGLVTQERIIDVSDHRRRVAYSVIRGTPMTHHNASMQLFELGPNRCRFVWIADFLPAEFGGTILPLMEQGSKAMKKAVETGAFEQSTIEEAQSAV